MTPKAQWIHALGIVLLTLFCVSQATAKPEKSPFFDEETEESNSDTSTPPRDPAAVNLSVEEKALRGKFSMLDAVAEGTKDTLSFQELRQIYDYATYNPVTTLKTEIIKHYDPTGEIGFCFGRALTAQLYARLASLNPKSIAKLFIIGALSTRPLGPNENPEWRFHVTTLVRGPNKGNLPTWYAIDPIMHEEPRGQLPLTMTEWIARVQDGWDTYHGQSPKAKLYVTYPSAIMPDLSVLNIPEVGNRIIELNFIPENYKIFPAQAKDLESDFGLRINYPIYTLKENITSQLFLSTHYNYPKTAQFPLLSLALDIRTLQNGQTHSQPLEYSFNGYFTDLFNSLRPDSEKAKEDLENKIARINAQAIRAKSARGPVPMGTRAITPTRRLFPYGLTPTQAPPRRYLK